MAYGGFLSRSIVLVLAIVQPVFGDEIWVSPSHLATPALNLLWPTTRTGIVSLAFAVPDDMEAFVSASVVLLPAISVADQYDVFAEAKRSGETVDVGDVAFSLDNPVTLISNELQEVDVTPLISGLLDSTSGGRDHVSVFFWFPTGSPAANMGRVLGMRFVYDRIDGSDGLSCWDLNSNFLCDTATEDQNTDGVCSALDCRGPQGPSGRDGRDGDDGVDGVSCWDLNGNRRCDRSSEDKNDDGVCTSQDCQGPPGPPGPPVSTSAVCQTAGFPTCTGLCNGADHIVSKATAPCFVTADTGSCGATLSGGACCVCKP